MKSSALSFVLCVLVWMIGSANAAGTAPLSAPTSQDLNQALLHGDAPRAKEVAAALKLDPTMVKLVEAQLDYDLPGLLAAAKVCRDSAMLRNELAAALSCNGVAYRSAFAMGDAREAFRTLVWVKKVGFPAMTRMHRGTPGFGNAFDRADIDQIAKSLPPFFTKRSPDRASLDYSNAPYKEDNAIHLTTHASGASIIPAVTIVVNGKQLKAFVDTGSASSVVMDQAHATELGVKTLVAGLPAIATLGRSPATGSTSLALVDELVFGPLTVHDVMAIVVPTGYLPGSGVMVGLPLLARFQQVEFGRSRLTVGGTASGCNDPLALTFASSPREDGKLVFDAGADGKPIKASIDTGADVPLIAGRHLAPPSVDNDSAVQSATVAQAGPIQRYLKVWFGKSHLSYDDTPVIPTLEVPDVLIGAPILAGWDVHFDFLKPSLCLAPTST